MYVYAIYVFANKFEKLFDFNAYSNNGSCNSARKKQRIQIENFHNVFINICQYQIHTVEMYLYNLSISLPVLSKHLLYSKQNILIGMLEQSLD